MIRNKMAYICCTLSIVVKEDFIIGRDDKLNLTVKKPVKIDAGQLSLDEEAKKEAWKEHYERLLNVEFPWNPEDLSEESPVEGPSEPITLEMNTKAITKMASGKAAGPSGIVAEMLKPVGVSWCRGTA